MGARHQTFIIAKVGTGARRRYRCIAAFDWQLLYGQGPARSATRFIRAVKNPTNSILIQADLDTFYEYDSEYTDCEDNGDKYSVPCPYITMLYRAATCVGVDDGLYDRCHTRDANMKTNKSYNDSGITIFDVTDPLNPRYCMVFLGDEEDQSKCYRPMSAKTYVESYYPFINPASTKPPSETATRETIEALKTAYQELEGVPLINSASLSEAFPGEYDVQSTEWTTDPKGNDSSESNDKQGPHAAPDIATPLPSLFSITAKKILQTALAEPDNSGESVELLLRSPIDASILDILRTELLERSEIPDGVLPLVAKLLLHGSGTRGFVDATPFTLSPDQLASLASMITSCEILKLGGRNVLHIDVLGTMIATLPSLKILVLFNKGISTDEVESLRSVGHPGQLQIAHKLSYFAKSHKTPAPFGSRSAELEFAFMMLGEPGVMWANDRLLQESAGFVKMEDPNFVIRALCDLMSLLWSYGRYNKRNGLSQVCFGVSDRPYGAVFASSSLVDVAPEPRFPSTVTKWIFVMKASLFMDPTSPSSYGFVRYDTGEVVDILDLEGFIKALHVERPDLPPVVGFGTKAEGGSSNFYHDLASIIGASLPTNDEGAPKPYLPCKLISRKEVDKVINSFTGKQKMDLTNLPQWMQKVLE